MKAYMELVEDVLDHGELRPSRVGNTYSLFGRMLEHDMRWGFPILTTRKIHWRPIVGELAAFLEGADNIDDFKKHGCNYWDADAARWNRDGDLGRIYGVQWRRWRTPVGTEVDQLRVLVNGLIADPFGRRHIITAWNPGEMHLMALPPCHVFAQFSVSQTHEFLDCCVYMRSVDLCLGLPADLVLYGALQHLVAKEVGLTPRKLVFMLADAHVYENHADLWMSYQSGREPRVQHPAFIIAPGNGLFNFNPERVELRNYLPHDPIKYPLNT